MQRTTRRQFLGAALAAGSAIATGIVAGPGVARAQSRGLTPVRFTCGANLGYTNLFVADGAGLFRKHGIDSQVILFDVGFLGTEAVLAGTSGDGDDRRVPDDQLRGEGGGPDRALHRDHRRQHQDRRARHDQDAPGFRRASAWA